MYLWLTLILSTFLANMGSPEFYKKHKTKKVQRQKSADLIDCLHTQFFYRKGVNKPTRNLDIRRYFIEMLKMANKSHSSCWFIYETLNIKCSANTISWCIRFCFWQQFILVNNWKATHQVSSIHKEN